MFSIYYTAHIAESFSASSASEGVEWKSLDTSLLLSIRLRQSYSPSSECTLVIVAKQHERPIPARSLVIIYDDQFSTDLTRPVFEGHVYDIRPKESNRVEYLLYSQDMRARQEVVVMSGPHGDPASIPRLVYNAKIDNDDDRAFEFRHNASVGVMLRDMLTFAYNELVSLCDAAPPPMIGGPAYIDSELIALDMRPQEKVVFETEKIGQAIDRLLGTHYPQYRVWFEPGLHTTGRKWRVRNATSSPTVTLTLNEFSGAQKVFALSLASSREGRATAVEIYGPPVPVFDVVYWRNHHQTQPGNDESSSSILGGGLIALWSTQQELNFRQFGPFSRPEMIGNAGKAWQVADPLKRRLARILPFEILISTDKLNWLGADITFMRTRNPTFEVTFDDRRWIPCNSAKLDLLNGIITLPYIAWEGANFPSSQDQPSSSVDDIGEYRLPSNARFQFAYYGPAIVARAPESGFAGSAYAMENMRVVDKRYDEMLAIGYEAGGLVVTTEERLTQYRKLAQSYLEPKKDVIYTGGVTLAGIDYSWWGLHKRVNIAGVNEDGQPIETGWENIRAKVTEVEWDYEESTTTLILNGDQMEFTQQDPDRLKESLRIRAQEVREVVTLRIGVGERLKDVRFAVIEGGKAVGVL